MDVGFRFDGFWTLLFAPDQIFLSGYTLFSHLIENISAVTRDFQQCDMLTKVDSDEPVQPLFKLRNS